MSGPVVKKDVVFKVVASITFPVILIACWSAGYAISRSLFPKWWPQASDFTIGVTSGILGFFLFLLAMFLISKLFPRRHRELFQMVIDALRRIAKGDFSVNLDVKIDHMWGELVDGINHMAEQLNEMEQLRQEFISNVSHEIQSPLTSIRGFARALQNEKLTHEERQHYLQIIETESARLSKISENLLKLTSLEGKHHPVERKRYSLDQQLRRIILACEPQWLEKELELDIILDKVEIVADEEMLSQVWNNLINNSIKFTPSGGKLQIQLREAGEEVLVRVTDTGIGIAKEDQGRVFERFFKADKSRNRTSGGSGLGLSIVKKIIDLHQGTITVQSELGEGTTFIVTLPAVPRTNA
ncbi:HAMP domain-containing sensor histidine kinase [Brevibacillus nitrificans]|uniref:histidine kinase n=1 Tax=Brevibacillus nitrificans TaxID=651560 RepID=A0A3M8CYV9_9BACL|nr:HAMP domain-containing sensor histidine kinase [Brevibacillus nitrificans]RNB80619.1 HAMP domain-containing sensor histidine kinase [Brevibacillus nitrificans]